MARHMDRQVDAVEDSRTATQFPSRYFPPVTYRDLPEGAPLRRVLGPRSGRAARACR